MTVESSTSTGWPKK